LVFSTGTRVLPQPGAAFGETQNKGVPFLLLERCSVSFLGAVGSAESRIQWQPSKPVKTLRTKHQNIVKIRRNIVKIRRNIVKIRRNIVKIRRNIVKIRRNIVKIRRNVVEKHRNVVGKTSQLVGTRRNS